MKTSQKVAEECMEKFNDLTKCLGNEDRWESAAELQATLEGVLMERDELEDGR